MRNETSRSIGDPLWLLVGVFTASLALYLISPVITSGDSAWTTPTALSLIHEHNPDLNEYPEFIARHNPKAVEWIDGRAYSIFPVAISLTAVPFVWAAEWALPWLWASFPALETLIREKAQGLFELSDGPLGVMDVYPAVELVSASTYTALAVLVFFIMARRRLSLLRALALTALFGFGSSLWSTTSRALWSHGPAILLLLLALLSLTHPTRKRAGIAGLFMAMAFLVRPTFALPSIAFGLFLLINNRRLFLHYTLAAALPMALFLIGNIHLYGQPLPTYFSPGRILVLDHVAIALAGHLISPARGLLVYSPFLVLAARPVYAALRSFDVRRLDFFMACVIPLHLLVVSTFWHWWGGYSIGPA